MPAPSINEYVQKLLANFARNKAYAKDDQNGYTTFLEPAHEIAFRRWVMANKIPFNPDHPIQDYDMRGFFKALMSGDEKAKSAINKNDNQIHYPDYWKTPYHSTFSADSQWATKMAPEWNDQDQLVQPVNGAVIYDERSRQ